jgi:zinc/manganese transport system substrate-binding protein
MNKRIVAALVLALALAAGAGAAPLNIVATTSDIADLARRIAGEEAVVTSICSGREDPHYLTAKPSFIARARRADVWMAIGLELESAWELPILNGSRNRAIQVGADGYLDLSRHVEVQDVPHGPICRSMGDVHPGGNPHYWLDPLNGRRMAEAIAERLARLRPEQAGAFHANLTAFQRELDERMFGVQALEGADAEALWDRHARGETIPNLGGWAAELAPLRGKGIVTYHKSWTYFANRFGLRVVGEIEPKPGIPPTAAHLTALTDAMQADGTGLILQEPFYSRKAADRLAAATGARVVVAANSAGGRPEATDYLAMLDRVVALLAGR